MARFMVSMPDEMVKKLDLRAHEEHRSRSELLREAARQHLAATSSVQTREDQRRESNDNTKGPKRWTKQSLERHLLENRLARKGCPGLDSLIGPIKGPVDMKKVLRITKKLTGLSRQVIEDREDRV